jgi:ribosomal protein S10
MTAETTAKKPRAPRAKKSASAGPSRLRIKVRAYEHAVLDRSVKQIIDTAARYNA